MDFDDMLPDLDLPGFDASGFDDDLFVTHEQISINIKIERRAARREVIVAMRHEALIELVPTFPPTDTDLILISTGDGAAGRRGSNTRTYDFGDFLPHAVNLFGAGCTAYVSTWCANFDHVTTMLELLKTGKVQHFVFFSDPYFQSRTPAIANQLISGLMQYPDRARYKLFHNHTKIICVRSADRQRHVTVMGSANLNMQRRAENYNLYSASEVYDGITEKFFEHELAKKERTGIQRRNRGKVSDHD